jgi:hypothetical protein
LVQQVDIDVIEILQEDPVHFVQQDDLRVLGINAEQVFDFLSSLDTLWAIQRILGFHFIEKGFTLDNIHDYLFLKVSDCLLSDQRRVK